MKFAGAAIGDAHLATMTKAMPNLEHVELIACDSIGEFGVNSFITNCPKLILLDIAKIPFASKYGFLDELKSTNPTLLIRRNLHHDDDFKKDNGLRVPRRIV